MDYDSLGRLDKLIYPTSTADPNFEVDYDYDAYGRLQYVKDANDTYTFYTLNETDALGREIDVDLGNGRNETHSYDKASGYLTDINTDGSVQDLDFTYDEVGNVLTRHDALISETETFTYDDINRLATSQVSGESMVTLTYSDAGRILTKTGCSGTWTYGAGSAGPNAVTSACGLSYTYDANGRMVTRGSGEITWTSFDKPSQIDDDSDAYYTQFWYGPDRARYKQYNSETDATIVYIGQLFEFEDDTTDIYRHYVQAGDRVVAIVERDDVGDPDDERMYLHRDNQGSVTKITDASGSVSQALAYDAWGLRRDATDWSALTNPFSGSHETERGYTGHEHLDTVGLIHMNGRVQDPILGRFISADPLIQAPYNTQSHNRYSYVWNNPATMMDPSGFCGMNSLEQANIDDCSNDLYLSNAHDAYIEAFAEYQRGAIGWETLEYYRLGYYDALDDVTSEYVEWLQSPRSETHIVAQADDGTVANLLAGLTEEQKAANMTTSMDVLNDALNAIRNATELKVPSKLKLFNLRPGGEVAAIRCNWAWGCGKTLYVSRELLQAGVSEFYMLGVAYHEVLHFNDSRATNIFIAYGWNNKRHDEITRLENSLYNGGLFEDSIERAINDEFLRIRGE